MVYNAWSGLRACGLAQDNVLLQATADRTPRMQWGADGRDKLKSRDTLFADSLANAANANRQSLSFELQSSIGRSTVVPVTCEGKADATTDSLLNDRRGGDLPGLSLPPQ